VSAPTTARRVGVVSDVHGDAIAVEAVLAERLELSG
jgi:hypothetical protein